MLAASRRGRAPGLPRAVLGTRPRNLDRRRSRWSAGASRAAWGGGERGGRSYKGARIWRCGVFGYRGRMGAAACVPHRAAFLFAA